MQVVTKVKINLPVLTTNEDTFTVAAQMKDLRFKIRSEDHDKIARSYELLKNTVDVYAILDALKH